MSENKKHFQKKADVRYRYVPVMETLENEDVGNYVSYGISVRTVEDEIAFVSDISTDLEAVQKLADRCTEQELSPEHLCDVIDDFLADEVMTLA